MCRRREIRSEVIVVNHKIHVSGLSSVQIVAGAHFHLDSLQIKHPTVHYSSNLEVFLELMKIRGQVAWNVAVPVPFAIGNCLPKQLLPAGRPCGKGQPKALQLESPGDNATDAVCCKMILWLFYLKGK